MRVLFALLALAGCGEGVATLAIPGARALLVAELGASPRLTAYDASGPVRRDIDPTRTSYVLAYDAPLEDVELEPGPLTLATEGAALPRPDHVHRLEGGAWTELTEVPAEIAALELAFESRCARFRVRQVPFLRENLDESAVFALPLDRARVLVGTNFRRYFVVTADGFLVDEQLELPFFGGAVRGEELWLVGQNRRVMRGHPDRGFTDAPPLPFDVGLDVVVAASPPDQPLELFITDNSLAVARFDGEQWAVIRAPTPVTGPRQYPGLAWIEPGIVALTGTEEMGIVELSRDGFERLERFTLPERSGTPDAFSAIGRVEGVGVVASTRWAVTYVRREGQWTQLPLASVTPLADGVIDLGGSFLVGGQDGIFVEYRADGTLCPALTGAGFRSAEAFARLGAGFITVSKGDDKRYFLTIAERAD